MLYLAAVLIVASVALFVAAPLGGGLLAVGRAGRGAAEKERLEHERGLAMQALRELEFDREMGKLAETDYLTLHESLMARALTASTALERLHTGATALAAPARPRLVRAAAGTGAAIGAGPAVSTSSAAAPMLIRFCPQCGFEVAGGKFCSECGAPVSVPARTAARAER